MISIIIPVFNKLEYTQECISTVRAFTPEKHEILFIDNGSSDGTHEYLRDLCAANPNYTLIRNEVNTGFPHAINQGVEFSKGEYICLLNNDVYVTPEWLSGMMACINHRSDVGIVGPRTNYISGIQQVNDGKYSDPLEMIEYSRTHRKAYRGFYFASWRLPFFCTLIKREVFDKIGMLDEQFSPGNFEDDDFEVRASRAGIKAFVCGDVFVHHFGSVSHGKDHLEIINTNREKFKAKHLKTSISCCMIVKNEEATIEKCLSRIVPLVDEVILVDTGSTDETKNIAGTFGKVRIYDFPWCNDFSAARNFSLDKATKDWIYILDADEVLPELDRSKLYPMTAYRYESRNYTDNILTTGNRNCTGEYGADEKGKFWFPSTKIRLFPNDKRIRFQYPVHEVVEESVYQIGLFVDTSTVPVHHYGKYDADRDSEKGKEYIKLLEQIVKDSPNDIRNLEQLGSSKQGLSQWDDAIKVWDHIIEIDPDNIRAWHNKGHALAHKNRDFSEAIKCFKRATEIDEKDRDSQYNYGYSLYELGDYVHALEIAEGIIKDNPDYLLAQALRNSIKEKMEVR